MSAVAVWVLRAAWAASPFTVGPAISDALDAASHPVAVVAGTIAWVVWGVVLAATLVPRTTSLTVVRIGAPAALAAAVWAALGEHADAWDAVALAWTVLTVTVALAAPTADEFVDGSSYGPERRLALRAPGLLLFGPIQLAWAALVAGAVAGPLLLAARSWVAGVVLLGVGGVIAAVAGQALHTLSRRWVVFVPAGVVLHDPLALTEPMLFPRAMVRRLGPAETGVDALDLSMRSPGLVLHLQLTEATTVGVAKGRRPTELVQADAVLFTPARPATLLAEARARRLPVS